MIIYSLIMHEDQNKHSGISDQSIDRQVEEILKKDIEKIIKIDIKKTILLLMTPKFLVNHEIIYRYCCQSGYKYSIISPMRIKEMFLYIVYSLIWNFHKNKMKQPEVDKPINITINLEDYLINITTANIKMAILKHHTPINFQNKEIMENYCYNQGYKYSFYNPMRLKEIFLHSIYDIVLANNCKKCDKGVTKEIRHSNRNTKVPNRYVSKKNKHIPKQYKRKKHNKKK